MHCRRKRVAAISRYVLSYDHAFFRDPSARALCHSLRVGTSRCLTLMWIDVISARPVDPSAPHPGIGMPRYPLVLPCAGAGDFTRPFWLDLSDELVKAGAQYFGPSWFTFVTALNCYLRSIPSQAMFSPDRVAPLLDFIEITNGLGIGIGPSMPLGGLRVDLGYIPATASPLAMSSTGASSSSLAYNYTADGLTVSPVPSSAISMTTTRSTTTGPMNITQSNNNSNATTTNQGNTGITLQSPAFHAAHTPSSAPHRVGSLLLDVGGPMVTNTGRTPERKSPVTVPRVTMSPAPNMDIPGVQVLPPVVSGNGYIPISDLSTMDQSIFKLDAQPRFALIIRSPNASDDIPSHRALPPPAAPSTTPTSSSSSTIFGAGFAPPLHDTHAMDTHPMSIRDDEEEAHGPSLMERALGLGFDPHRASHSPARDSSMRYLSHAPERQGRSATSSYHLASARSQEQKARPSELSVSLLKPRSSLTPVFQSAPVGGAGEHDDPLDDLRHLATKHLPYGFKPMIHALEMPTGSSTRPKPPQSSVFQRVAGLCCLRSVLRNNHYTAAGTLLFFFLVIYAAVLFVYSLVFWQLLPVSFAISMAAPPLAPILVPLTGLGALATTNLRLGQFCAHANTVSVINGIVALGLGVYNQFSTHVLGMEGTFLPALLIFSALLLAPFIAQFVAHLAHSEDVEYCRKDFLVEKLRVDAAVSSALNPPASQLVD